MKKKYDAVATIGKYTDKQGNEKKRYLNVGIVFEGDDGRLSMKMDALPTAQEWSGWISFYEPKENDQYEQRKMHGSEPRRTAAGGVAVDKDDELDDIPF